MEKKETRVEVSDAQLEFVVGGLPEAEIYAIASSSNGRVYFGDSVTLALRNADQFAGAKLMWQCSTDGQSWQDVASGTSHTFTVNESTVGLSWRLVANE